MQRIMGKFSVFNVRFLIRHALYCVCIAMTIMSCDTKTPYYHYAHTPIDGWEKNDTLRYEVSPLEKGGEYHTSVGLRLNGAYPFRKLYLIMEQEIFPSLQRRTDTICFDVTSKEGRFTGNGISYYQYTLPVCKEYFTANDSIHITIRHAMKRDILPGISDIGVRLTRK